MLGIVIIFIICFCLYKWFYHTIIVLAIWWQVFENFFIIGQTHFTSICSFIISMFFVNKIINKEIQLALFPLWKPFLFLLFCYAISILNSINFNIGNILRVLSMFIIPIVSFYAINKIKEFWMFLLINIGVFASIITCVGFVELSLGFNPMILYLQSINLGDYSAEQGESYIRFGMYRCQSLFVWCSTYGISCGFTMIFLLMLSYYKRYTSVIISLLLNGLLMFGMLTCGTRSVYVACAIAFMAYILQLFSNTKHLVIVSLISVLFYYTSNELLDAIIDSIRDVESVGGSDITLRLQQFDTAFNKFLRSPIWGNGYGACQDFINKSSSILGAESFLFWVLIDRGLLGFIATIYLLYAVVAYVKKYSLILSFIPIGLMIGKFFSLLPTIEETYYFFYLFVIIRAYKEFKLQKYVLVYSLNK